MNEETKEKWRAKRAALEEQLSELEAKLHGAWFRDDDYGEHYKPSELGHGTYPRKKCLKEAKAVRNKIARITELIGPEPKVDIWGNLMDDEDRERTTKEESGYRYRRPTPRPPVVIPARACLTCFYRRRSKFKSAFVRCKLDDTDTPLWEKLHCMYWKFTKDREISAEMKEYVEFDQLFYDYQHRKTPPNEVPPQYRSKMHEEAPINLARCCFTCRSRTGNVQKGFVYCPRRKQKVWELGCCREQVITTKFKTIIQFKKYIERYGNLDFRQVVGWDK